MNMTNASMTEFALKYGCNPNQSPARVLMTGGGGGF